MLAVELESHSHGAEGGIEVSQSAIREFCRAVTFGGRGIFSGTTRKLCIPLVPKVSEALWERRLQPKLVCTDRAFGTTKKLCPRVTAREQNPEHVLLLKLVQRLAAETVIGA